MTTVDKMVIPVLFLITSFGFSGIGISQVTQGDVLVPQGDVLVPQGDVLVPQGDVLVPQGDVVVLFESASDRITETADSTLQSFIEKIDVGRIDPFEIVAHTDAIGQSAYNIGLSKRRATSVRDWLMDLGIDSSQCLLSWKGEADSLVSNASVEQRELNRRALITAYVKRPMNMVEGIVQDSNDTGIDAAVVIRGSEFIDSTRTDSTGYFSLLAPEATVLAVDVYAKGYVYATRMFKNERKRELKLDFRPAPIQRGVKFQLRNFYFVGNKAILLESSKPELVKLLRFMTLNPTTIIAVEGHINNPNTRRDSKDSEHFDLSERRAKLVFDYLVKQKVNPKRLSYEGFANWHMVYPKARFPEEHAKNRRVEIRIVEQ
jgi:outer membrane protein OmpA-like peptidoglycan-associated protein